MFSVKASVELLTVDATFFCGVWRFVQSPPSSNILQRENKLPPNCLASFFPLDCEKGRGKLMKRGKNGLCRRAYTE